MGQKVTTFKAYSAQPIQYRFFCEHCSRNSGWRSYTIHHEECLELGGWNARLSPEQEKELNAKALAELQKKIGNAMGDCQTQRYPFSDICPFCGKHQSWGNKTLCQYIFSVPVCVGTLLTAILWMTSLLDNAFAWWIILSSTAASLIGTLIYVIRRKAQTSGTAKNIPEIDWRGKQ